MFQTDDNRYENPQISPEERRQKGSTRMSYASIGCAIFGLFGIVTGYFGILFGSLAVVFSCLSKGARPKAERLARYGRWIGTAAAAVGAAIVIYSFVMVFSQYGSLENFYNAYYGITTEETTETGTDAGEAL